MAGIDQSLPQLYSLTNLCFAEVIEAKRADATAANRLFDVTTLLTKTLLGLKAVPSLQREMRGWNAPVGRLIRPLRRQEISERDGENGRPLWITFGQNAFDITGTSDLSICNKLHLVLSRY